MQFGTISTVIGTLLIITLTFFIGESSGYSKGFKASTEESSIVITRHQETITKLSNEINEISAASVRTLAEHQSKITELNRTISDIRINHRTELSSLYTELNNLKANPNVKTYLNTAIPNDVIRLLDSTNRTKSIGIKINPDTDTNPSMQ